MSYRFDCSDSSGRSRGVVRARAALEDGELVVVPTESSYGLACDAFSTAGIAALRAVKGNRRLVPPVLIGSVRTLDGLAADVSPQARELAQAFWPGQLTLVCHPQPTLEWRVAGPQAAVSLRMPLHPVALQLLVATGPLALTSANTTGLLPPTTYDAAEAMIGEAASVYLDAGTLGYGGPSTVVDVRSEHLRVLRHGDVTLEQLRSVVPGVLDVDDPEPEPEPEDEPADEPEDEPAAGADA